MDTRWFQDFVTLAEVRNFTRAAELRNVSQAAFSRRVQGLEQWLGARLIDRSAFPTRLTPAGERFREVAVGLLAQIADAKAELGDVPARNHVRVAMPYALATTRLTRWWLDWSAAGALSCSVEVGNVHDTVSDLSAGTVDLLVCFEDPAHPIQVDESRFDRHQVGSEYVRPYAARTWVEAHGPVLPGSAARPVPLLMYSGPVYFASVVASIIERAPRKLFGYRAFEVEMSDVLADLASQGAGVAWLPESTLERQGHDRLVAVGEGDWDTRVSIVAYRAKTNLRRPVEQVWARVCALGVT